MAQALGEGGPQPDVLDDESLQWVPAWYERIYSRPAAKAADPSRGASL